MSQAPDFMVILAADPPCLEVLRTVAQRLGCDHAAVDDVDEMAAVLAWRQPTLAVLAVDRLSNAGYGAVPLLAEAGRRPATVLVGALDPRVLASVRCAADARGLPIIGTYARPLDPASLERLLTPVLNGAPPIRREEIERGLAGHEFHLAYQPKIRIGGGACAFQGVEALVRWRHPHRGDLQPRHFWAAVEAFGLECQVTDFVITEAVRQAGTWRRADLALELVVNLSPRLVTDRGFPDRLQCLLEEHDVPPDRIVLDVTETAASLDRDLMLDVFTRLRIAGVGLALDNFGVGTSSLTELYRMPFSEVKVDRGLLADVARERDAEVIVRGIVRLAHDLGLAVCAEGVETRDLLEFARSANFDAAQGHLFCAPARATEIERLMRTWPQATPALRAEEPLASARAGRRRAAATQDSRS